MRPELICKSHRFTIAASSLYSVAAATAVYARPSLWLLALIVAAGAANFLSTWRLTRQVQRSFYALCALAGVDATEVKDIEVGPSPVEMKHR